MVPTLKGLSDSPKYLRATSTTTKYGHPFQFLPSFCMILQSTQLLTGCSTSNHPNTQADNFCPLNLKENKNKKKINS